MGKLAVGSREPFSVESHLEVFPISPLHVESLFKQQDLNRGLSQTAEEDPVQLLSCWAEVSCHASLCLWSHRWKWEVLILPYLSQER